MEPGDCSPVMVWQQSWYISAIVAVKTIPKKNTCWHTVEKKCQWEIVLSSMFPKRAKQLYAQKSDFSLHMSMESQAFSSLWLFKDQTAPKHIGSYPQKGTQQQQQTQTPPTTTNNHHWIIYPNYLQKKNTKIDLQELQRIKSSPICRVVDPPFGQHSKKLGIEIPALHFFAFILWCAFFGCKKSLEVGGGGWE